MRKPKSELDQLLTAKAKSVVKMTYDSSLTYPWLVKYDCAVSFCGTRREADRSKRQIEKFAVKTAKHHLRELKKFGLKVYIK